jgi:hypothetical protein
VNAAATSSTVQWVPHQHPPAVPLTAPSLFTNAPPLPVATGFVAATASASALPEPVLATQRTATPASPARSATRLLASFAVERMALTLQRARHPVCSNTTRNLRSGLHQRRRPSLPRPRLVRTRVLWLSLSRAVRLLQRQSTRECRS